MANEQSSELGWKKFNAPNNTVQIDFIIRNNLYYTLKWIFYNIPFRQCEKESTIYYDIDIVYYSIMLYEMKKYVFVCSIVLPELKKVFTE